MAILKNPDQESDYLLSTSEAAAYLAAMQNRPPYSLGTLRQWLTSGTLKGEQDDAGRWSVRLSDLQQFAAKRGMVAAPAPKAPAAPVQPAREAPAQAVATNPASKYRLVPVDEDPEDGAEEPDDFDMVECPECGAEVPVSSAAILVECPGCGKVLEVQEAEAEEDEDEEPEPAAAKASPAPAPAKPQPTPAQPEKPTATNPIGFAYFFRRARR